MSFNVATRKKTDDVKKEPRLPPGWVFLALCPLSLRFAPSGTSALKGCKIADAMPSV
jgi:hypothetical protein